VKTRMLLGAVGLVLTLPGNAWADSGSVTDIHAVAGGQLQATFTASHSFCTTYGYCGWFPEASQVPATSPCDRSSLIWVGDNESDPGTQTRTDTFYPMGGGSLRLCVYTYDAVNGAVLVGQTIYTPPPPPPPPTAPPVTTTPAQSASPTPDVAPLTIADARLSLTGVLRQKFAGRFTSHRNFKRDCYRLTVQKVRCRVRWDHGHWRYAGAVDMRNAPEDPEGTILYTNTIRRKRINGAPPSRPSGGSGPSHTSPSCDSSYKGACLNPNASDYDCAGGSGDGPYYVQGPITVVGDDHYGLDRDGDGIACES
jgi:hypothetical protein